MADNIRLITYSAQTVKAVNDANVYEAALGAGGIKYGCEVTAASGSSNTLHISAGNGVLCGRAFEIFETDIQVQLSGSGNLYGRVYLHLDLSNTAEPIQIMTETGDSLTDPIQDEDVNVINGIYEINLATFTVTTSAILDVENVAPKLTNKTLKRVEYFRAVTKNVAYTFQIPDYDSSMIVDAYLNGLRLAESEFSVSASGLFSLTATLTTDDNAVQIVVLFVG